MKPGNHAWQIRLTRSHEKTGERVVDVRFSQGATAGEAFEAWIAKEENARMRQRDPLYRILGVEKRDDLRDYAD